MRIGLRHLSCVSSAVAASMGLCQLGLSQSLPPLTAKSAIVMDAESGRVLWSKNADVARFPASTTKIMTALLLLEHTKPTDIVTAPPDIDKVPPSSMHLKPGEKLTAHDLLYAMMLRSANDGAVTVAYNVSGSIPAFVAMMNQRAKELGCTNTHFDNPNGLNDPLHTTTAHDLALIAREAMKYPEFREVVHTYRYKIQRSMNEKDLWMVNTDKLLVHDPTEDGVKTGWTVPAGHCFVGSATREGYRIFTVVLHSNDWKKETDELMNWAFATHERKQIAPAETPILQSTVSDGSSKTVPIGSNVPIVATFDRSAPEVPLTATFDPSGEVSAPLEPGERIGTIRYLDPQGVEYAQSPAIALASVPLATNAAAMTTHHFQLTYFLIGGGLTGVMLVMRQRVRRKYLGAYGRRRFYF